jgi:competence protein ComEA
MGQRRLVSVSGSLGKVLAWRYPTACSLLLTFALTTGIAVMLLERSDNWPPTFARAHSTIAITGPGIKQTIEGYVLGAVLQPGVYTMQRGARVKDLVLAAGGLLDNADITRVEMAGLLADGQSVYVPRLGERVPLQLGGKVNLNVASVTDLHNALGVSTTVARKIVNYRSAHGTFTAVSQLLLVPVSKATYDRIKDLVTI